jgi:hypothetical protein
LSRTLFLIEGTTSLNIFLEVMYRLGVKPIAFLDGTAKLPSQLQTPASPHRRWRNISVAQLLAAHARLQAIVAELPVMTNLVVTVASVAQRLQITPEACYRHFQYEMKLLRAHNLNARPKMNAEKRTRKIAFARQTMRDLFAQQGPYSRKSIIAALAVAGVHWSNTEAVAAANDELAMLMQEAA